MEPPRKIRLASLHEVKVDLANASYGELDRYTTLVEQRLDACERDLSLIQEELGRRAVHGEPVPLFTEPA